MYKLIALFALLFSIGQVYGQIAVTPQPDWVVSVEPGKKEEGDTIGGIDFLLVDRQVRADQDDLVHYCHLVVGVANHWGVEGLGQLCIEFDPSTERLELHSVTIHRGDQSINCLNPERIHELRRESDLEHGLINGCTTAMLVLEDLQVGDVVDYSYSQVEHSSAMGGDCSLNYPLNAAVPIHKRFFRLLWPKDRPIYIDGPEPLCQECGQSVDYHWEGVNIAAFTVEEDIPTWCSPQSILRVTSFSSWNEVAKWAAPLYQSPTELSEQLQAFLGELKAESQDARSQLAHVVQEVQQRVRYLGMEEGIGGLVPADPSHVFRCRYGDCKGQTRLLCTLLNHLGIYACPMLVSTDLQHHITDHNPSPSLFDHVITYAEVDGKSYWIDPVKTYHRDGSENLPSASYGSGLLVHPNSQHLTPIPLGDGGQAEVHQEFDLSKGPEHPAQLKVTRYWRGSDAAAIRSYIDLVGVHQFASDMAEWYDDWFDAITESETGVYNDDPDNDIVTLSQEFAINDFWGEVTSDETYEFPLPAGQLLAFLEPPSQKHRLYPLAVEHPFQWIVTTAVHLPNEVPSDQMLDTVSNNTFDFSRQLAQEGNTVSIRYEYSSLSDHVSVEDYASVRLDLGRAQELTNISYAIPSIAVVIRPWALMMAGVCLFVGILLSLVIYRKRDRFQPLRPLMSGKAGFGGWFVFLFLGNIVSPLGILTHGISSLFNPEASMGDLLYAMWLVLDLPLAICVIVLMFKKHVAFPRVSRFLMIIGTMFTIVTEAINALESGNHEHLVLAALFQAIMLSIWASYLTRSRRVRSTFVNHHRPPLPTYQPPSTTL